MTNEELEAIEKRLELVLPDEYRNRLLQGVKINGHLPEPYFEQDAESLLIDNLLVRHWFGDFFQGGPWPKNLFVIGNDGCGDYYAIYVDDPHCAVWFWDHETDKCESSRQGIDEHLRYFDGICRWSEEPYRPWPEPAGPPPRFPDYDIAAITRTGTRRTSVLDPIMRDEWEAFVRDDTDLELRGYWSYIDPFTKEEERSERAGLAILKHGETVDEFEYGCGGIVVYRPSAAAVRKLQTAAIKLRAKLWANFDLPVSS